MPLHDWTDERGWDSVYPLWLTYLLEYVQERLPKGYKAFLGGVPSLTVDFGPRQAGCQRPANGAWHRLPRPCPAVPGSWSRTWKQAFSSGSTRSVPWPSIFTGS